MAKHYGVSKETARRRVEAAQLKGRPDGGSAAPGRRTTAKYDHKESGLQLFRRTGRIDAKMMAAGERYGAAWRTSQIEGEGAMKSSLAALLEGGGGVSGGAGGPGALIGVEMIAESRRQLHAAQAALGFNDGLVGACDVICGKQWTASQITAVRRDQEAIAVLLFTALNMLAKHYAAPPAPGLRGPDSVAA